MLCEGAGRSLPCRAIGGSGGRLRMMPLLTPLHDSSPPSRPNSIFGQRFMITSIPAFSATAAAASLRIPSCIHTTGAPIAIASSTIEGASRAGRKTSRSEEHTSELQSRRDLVCRLLLEKKKKILLSKFGREQLSKTYTA